jgi:hypothetical protein
LSEDPAEDDGISVEHTSGSTGKGGGPAVPGNGFRTREHQVPGYRGTGVCICISPVYIGMHTYHARPATIQSTYP